jgi:hypothetical protein
LTAKGSKALQGSGALHLSSEEVKAKEFADVVRWAADAGRLDLNSRVYGSIGFWLWFSAAQPPAHELAKFAYREEPYDGAAGIFDVLVKFARAYGRDVLTIYRPFFREGRLELEVTRAGTYSVDGFVRDLSYALENASRRRKYPDPRFEAPD